ncbi:hypothetical protein MMC30_004889 [Trapelia coarctata]|nr:hypothetical protein [Trapelia coarctata]
MAEGVFRSLTKSNPRILHVDSAGTSAYNIGCDPDDRTMATLEVNGISDYAHIARKVRSSDFTKFDYIFAMDRENLRDLLRLRQSVASKKASTDGLGKVSLFGDYGGRKGEEIQDPYYGALDGFEIAYEQVVRFTNGFLKEVSQLDVVDVEK